MLLLPPSPRPSSWPLASIGNAVVHDVQGTVLSECPHLLTPLVQEAVWLYQLLLSATGVIL
jgi:hypothetical protein